jgi:hypothetical protein
VALEKVGKACSKQWGKKKMHTRVLPCIIRERRIRENKMDRDIISKLKKT